MPHASTVRLQMVSCRYPANVKRLGIRQSGCTPPKPSVGIWMLVTVASRGKPGTEHCRAHLHIRAQLHGETHHSNSWSCRRCGRKPQNVVCRMATERGNPAQGERTAVCICTEEIRNSNSTWCRNCAGMPRNCDGRTVADRRNAAKGSCSSARSCAGETHNSHLFGLQGSLKPQVELMNRFIA